MHNICIYYDVFTVSVYFDVLNVFSTNKDIISIIIIVPTAMSYVNIHVSLGIHCVEMILEHRSISFKIYVNNVPEINANNQQRPRYKCE